MNAVIVSWSILGLALASHVQTSYTIPQMIAVALIFGRIKEQHLCYLSSCQQLVQRISILSHTD